MVLPTGHKLSGSASARWLEEDYGFDVYEAYFLLTQAGRVRVGNMVDSKYTLGASILKRYLPMRD